MSVGWLLHLSMCPTRPNPLFPKLDHLIFTSSDGLSLLVAVSAAPYAETLTICMDEKSNETHDEAVTSLTSSVCLVSQRLEHVSLLAPTHRNLPCILGNLRHCATLVSVEMHVQWDVGDVILVFKEFVACPQLKKMTIIQVVPPTQRRLSSAPDQPPDAIDVQEYITRESQIVCLEDLILESNSLTHLLGAKRLSPRSLTSLKLFFVVSQPREPDFALCSCPWNPHLPKPDVETHRGYMP